MFDTNTLDFVYDNEKQLMPKLKKLVKRKIISLYLTHVQIDEINSILDSSKKSKINKIITSLAIQAISTSGAVVGTNSPSKHGFLGSKTDMSKVMGDDDGILLNKLIKRKTTNPMGNSADLMILYTAIKEIWIFLLQITCTNSKVYYENLKILRQQD